MYKVIVIFLFSTFSPLRNVHSLVNRLLQRSPVINSANEIWSRILPFTNNFAKYGNLSLSRTRTLEVPTPSYVQILNKGILSVTSFSLLRKGSIMQFDLSDKNNPKHIKGEYLWPNELTSYQNSKGESVLLVPDGFLTPGQSDGGLYAVLNNNIGNNPVNLNFKPFRITAPKQGWFYHRAIHVRLPGGVAGILTARATKPFFGPGKGELVWLSDPDFDDNGGGVGPAHQPSGGRTVDEANVHSSSEVFSGSFVDKDSSGHRNMSQHLEKNPPLRVTNYSDMTYWRETVLACGPDVMFEVLDTNSEDDSVEIITAHFFDKRICVYSLRSIKAFPYVEAVEVTSLDTVGRPYGLCLATMNP